MARLDNRTVALLTTKPHCTDNVRVCIVNNKSIVSQFTHLQLTVSYLSLRNNKKKKVENKAMLYVPPPSAVYLNDATGVAGINFE